MGRAWRAIAACTSSAEWRYWNCSGPEPFGGGRVHDGLVSHIDIYPTLCELLDVERRIAELEQVRTGLSKLIVACPGHGRAADCPILKALGGEDT